MGFRVSGAISFRNCDFTRVGLGLAFSRCVCGLHGVVCKPEQPTSKSRPPQTKAHTRKGTTFSGPSNGISGPLVGVPCLLKLSCQNLDHTNTSTASLNNAVIPETTSPQLRAFQNFIPPQRLYDGESEKTRTSAITPGKSRKRLSLKPINMHRPGLRRSHRRCQCGS